MKLVIHGTKGGYNTFSPDKVSGLPDARPDSNKNEAIGNEAYSIHFNGLDVIFSKYRIIQDTIGDVRIGHVAFSVVIPNEEKLFGKDTKMLLDLMEQQYCSKYIDNNKFNSVKEDWSFLNDLKNDHHHKIKTISVENRESFPQGAQDAAKIYYTSDGKLERYFDFPYQDEYKKYKQIFLVEEKFKDKYDSPLNALRHDENADLTEKIDLDNIKYRLLLNESLGVSAKVTINGQPLKHRASFHQKDQLIINFSKPFYIEKTIEARLNNLEQGSDYLKVNEIERTLTVITPNKLEPQKKKVSFLLKNYKEDLIQGAQITLSMAYGNPIQIENNEFVFQADQIGKEWTVTAKKDKLKSNERIFIPEREDSIDIVLHQTKTIKFEIVGNDGEQLSGCKISISEKNSIGSHESFTFKDAELTGGYDVKISRENYKSNQFTLNLSKYEDNDLVPVELKKLEMKKYRLLSGEGKKIGGPDYDNFQEDTEDFSSLKPYFKPPKRHMFDKEKPFVKTEEGDGYDGTLTPSFKKKPFYTHPIVIAVPSAIIIASILVLLIFPTTRFYVKNLSVGVYNKYKNIIGVSSDQGNEKAKKAFETDSVKEKDSQTLVDAEKATNSISTSHSSEVNDAVGESNGHENGEMTTPGLTDNESNSVNTTNSEVRESGKEATAVSSANSGKKRTDESETFESKIVMEFLELVHKNVTEGNEYDALYEKYKTKSFNANGDGKKVLNVLYEIKNEHAFKSFLGKLDNLGKVDRKNFKIKEIDKLNPKI